MSRSIAPRTYAIAIKSAHVVIPGYGAEGVRYGELVPSEEIVAGIRPRRRPRQSQRPGAPPPQSLVEDLPGTWLRSLLGFESVATTSVTRAAAQEAIDSGLDWSAAAQTLRKPEYNKDIDAMLTQSIETALQRFELRSNRIVSRAHSILGHIHISSTSSVRTPYALLESRKAARCHKPGLPIINLLSGCSGLLFALDQARTLLDRDGQDDANAFVLITCSNDLLPFAHARGRCPEAHNQNIDEWLFQAIFGEGVGAIVVGRADPDGRDWIVEGLGWKAVTDDWRVTMMNEGGAPAMVIRAREVGQTFRQHVPPAAKHGLEDLGLTMFRDLHRLCVHESNPNLVAQIVSKLDAPADIVHSISARVGTLAGVSAFSLLDEALNSHRHPAPDRDSIVCALIGESGNSVVAGHVALRYSS